MSVHCWCVAVILFLEVQDDVMSWKRFPHYWPYKRGNHRSPVDPPHTKGQWSGALVFPPLMSAWTNCWTNCLWGSQVNWNVLRPIWRHCNDHAQRTIRLARQGDFCEFEIWHIMHSNGNVDILIHSAILITTDENNEENFINLFSFQCSFYRECYM